jgi:hypothetical protein
MTLALKPGARLHGLRPEMVVALLVAEGAFAQQGEACVVTTAANGHHRRGSLHYSGAAVDLRTRHLTGEQVQAVLGLLRSRLGADFDVVDEGDHIHLEWQPKQPLNGRAT